MATKNDNIENNGRSTTPSGEESLDAILKGVIGEKSVETFEHLIVNSITQLIYGSDVGKTASKLNNISSIAKKGKNPVDLLTSLNKNANLIEQYSKEICNANKTIKTSINEINKSLNDFFSKSISSFENLTQTPTPDSNASNVLSIILEGSNVDEILNALANLADDFVVEKLANSFQMLIDVVPKINSFDTVIEPFIENIKKFDELNNLSGNIMNFFDMFSDKLTTLNLSLDNTNLDKFSNLLQNLSTISSLKYDKDGFIAIKSILNELVNILSNIDYSSLNKKKLNSFVNTINTLGNLKNISNNLDWVNSIDKNFIKGIGNLPKLIKPLNALCKKLDKFKDLDTKKLSSLASAISIISNMKVDGRGINIDSSKLIKGISTLSRSMKKIGELNEKIKKFDFTDFGVNMKNISAALNYLNGLSFDGTGYIDIDEIDELISSNLFDKLNVIMTSIGNVNKVIYNNALYNSIKLEEILDNIEDIYFDPKNLISLDTLEKIENAVDEFKKICSTLNDININEDCVDSLDSLNDILEIISNIDVSAFKNKDFSVVSSALSGIGNIMLAIEKIDSSSVNNISIFETIINTLFADGGAFSQLFDNLSKMNVSNLDKIEQLTSAIQKISEAAKITAAIGSLGPAVEAGVKIIQEFIDAIATICDKINNINEKKLKTAISVIDGVAKLVAISTICMIIGGAFIVFFPKLVIGALAFGIVLGLFITTVLAGINIATSFGGGIDVAEDTLNGVANLILKATLAMILGGTFVIAFPKMVIASLAFGLALALFIGTTLAAINLATWFGGGIDIAEDTLNSIANLIVKSTFVMVLGAVFMMMPKMVANSFKFAITLATFIGLTLGAINLATKGMKHSFKKLEEFRNIIIISASVMMLGAVFMYIPTLAENALMFTGLLTTFIGLTLGAINLATRKMKSAKNTIKDLAIIVGLSAGVLLIGGMLFIKYPELIGTVPIFGGYITAFVLSMTLIANLLTKNHKAIQKGSIAMAILSGIALMFSTSMVIIRKAVEGATNDVWIGVGIMGTIIVGVAGIAFSLGTLMNTGVGAEIFMLGIAALGSISIIVGLASLALMGIAKSMDMFSKIKGFDAKPIISAIMQFASIIPELAIFGVLMPIIISASISISSLSLCISKISEAVKEAADLRISVYEGTKRVGYRHLKERDFTNAAKNVKQIVSILGSTIIDLYNQRKDIFAYSLNGNTPFSRVVASTTMLAKMISKITNAVKNYADLKIPIYSGTKVTSYRHLDDNDFKSAGKNIKQIILSLSLPLIDLYNENKYIYDDGSLFSGIVGDKPANTPLSRVISVSMQIGKLISKIASGVKDMATLRIGENYKDGKPTTYRKLTDQEIMQAVENTKNIVKSLSTSLIDLYNENKYIYDDVSLFSCIVGDKPQNTPLSRVISVSMKIGKLISKIASGVKDMATLRIGENYKDGKPTTYRKLTDQEIMQAGENTKNIVKSLSTSLIDLYNENKYIYDDGSLFSCIVGDKPANTPLSRVISVSMQIGKLISKIASGVKDMATLRIGENYKDGKPTTYRKLTDQEIMQAAINTKEIVKVLGNALMESYEDHSEWYEGNLKKTPFYKVLTTNIKLGNLIGSIGDAIGKMAKLRIPEEYDKNGKVISYRQLNNNDFKNASTNIAKVITVLGNAIMKQYEDNPSWFKDNNGKLLEDKKSPFAIVMKSTSEMGSLLSNLSEGIKNYSKLLIPTKWDPKTGKPIDFREMTADDFVATGKNIGKVVTTLGNSIMEIYKGHEDWFKDGGNILKKQDSPFTKTLNACIAMGDMISSISEGIIAMAKMQIPNGWDPKTGKPTQFREMTKNDFTNAANAIGKVVTTIGNTLLALYENDKYGMFDSENNEDTPFAKVAQGCSYLGELVKNIAEGVVEMATLERTLAKSGIKFDSNTYENAGKNISSVVTAIGNALMSTFDQHQDWFNNPPLKKTKSGWFTTKTEEIPNNADTPFQKMMNSTLLMGQMIIGIAQGITFFATITQQPIDKNGNKLDIATAEKNIGTILTTIGEAIIKTSNSSQFHSIDELRGIVSVVTKSVNVVNGIANLIQKIGTGKLITVDKNGNKISEIELNEATLTSSAELIAKILTTVSDAIGQAKMLSYKNNNGYNIFDPKSINNLSQILSVVDKAMNVVGSNATILARLSNFKMLYKNGDKEEYVDVKPADMLLGGFMISFILETISSGLSNAMNAIESNKDIEKIGKIIPLIGNALSVISENAQLLASLSTWQFPIFNKQTGERIDTLTTSKQSIETGASTIGEIIFNIASGIKNGTDLAQNLFGTNVEWKDTPAAKVLKVVEEGYNVVAKMAFFLANLANNKYTYTNSSTGKIENISFTKESLEGGATTIGTIISSIAEGIGNGAANAKEALNDTSIINGSFKKSKIYYLLKGLSMAKDTIGPLALFISQLTKGEYVYKQNGKSITTSFETDISKINAVTASIDAIISSLAESISNGVKNLTFYGFDDMKKINGLFYSLAKSTEILGDIAKVVYLYSRGEIAQVAVGNDGKMTITTTGAPNVEAAKTNMSNIVTGIIDIITDAATSINSVKNIDETFNNLLKSIKIVNAATYTTELISEKKQTILGLEGFKFGDIMGPIIADIANVYAAMNSIDSSTSKIQSSVGNFVSTMLPTQIASSPIQTFLNDVESMVTQAYLLSSAPMEESYNTLCKVVKSTMNTMNDFQMPENFSEQTKELDTFIKSVNSIKIEGVDSLTDLLKELNKLGINMGNLDGLTTAISKKLSITLQQCANVMKELNNTMKLDWNRKEKHKKEIKESVSEIQNAMSATMNVLVKMDESSSGTSTGGGTTETPQDDTNEKKKKKNKNGSGSNNNNNDTPNPEGKTF